MPTLISDIPVHREFHQDSSLFFPVDDDGGALADHVIACLQDRGLWTQLSQAGCALAHRLSLALRWQASKSSSAISAEPFEQRRLDSAQHRQVDLVFEMFFYLAAHALIGLVVEFTQAEKLTYQGQTLNGQIAGISRGYLLDLVAIDW